jgi:hypothetical protein
MSQSPLDKQELIERLHSLPAWKAQEDFTDQDWEQYIELARLVQSAGPDMVAAALDEFIQQTVQEEYQGYEGESKPFILMRVLFELPEAASVDDRRSFKGWSNWPDADANNQVNLSWPVSWEGGRPKLLDYYKGSMGLPYAAAAEYHYLSRNYPYRKL